MSQRSLLAMAWFVVCADVFASCRDIAITFLCTLIAQAWPKLPGFKTLLTCLLLELRARPAPRFYSLLQDCCTHTSGRSKPRLASPKHHTGTTGTACRYAEPLVELSNQLLRCTHLHSVLVKIVFGSTSVYGARPL